MSISRSSSVSLQGLEDHLRSWGLRSFDQEAAYYEWQRAVLSPEDLNEFNRLIQLRQTSADSSVDIHFYDMVANPHLAPILYSQRYEYYMAVGPAIVERIGSVRRVLDFGCGVGILTTYYGTLFSNTEFIGVDRSTSSIALARQQAEKRNLSNVHFQALDVPTDSLSGTFDLIISTHALFQAEKDPGLPSQGWNTFERAHAASLQRNVEGRSGLQSRLDSLRRVLTPGGRMLLCEKARHLGRKILLQRALASRSFSLMTEPLPLSYRSLGDEVEDGPLYEVKGGDRHQGFSWNEEPEIWEGQGIYSCKGIVAEEIGAYLSAQQTEQIVSFESSQLGRCCLKLGRWKGALAYGYLTSDSGFHGALLGSCHDEPVLYRSFGNLKDIGESDLQILLDRVWPSKRDKDNGGVTPCYENHSPSAQIIWSVLPGRRIEEEKTFQEGDGRQMHIEWGQCEGLSYLYWANTYDQRQLVLMENSRAHLLKEYYSESLTSVKDSPPSSSQ